MTDLFTTRKMLGTLETMFPPFSFILDTFYTMPPDFSVSEYVDIDIYKHKRKMAPFVSPLLPGKVLKREGFRQSTFKPPYVKPKMESTASDFISRAYGDNPYANVSIQDRAARCMVSDLDELMMQLTRREEWMATQALLYGELEVVGDGVSATIDFNRTATHDLTDGDLEGGGWDQAGADPLTDFKAWQMLIAKDAGLSANICVFGANAWDLFFADAQVQAELALFRSIGTTVNQDQSMRTGAMLMGRARGIWLYLYNEWYLDDNEDEQPMIPENMVIFGSTAARCRRHYGAIMDLAAGAGGASVRAFPKSWSENDPSVQYVMIQSSPLPVPHEIDGFVAANVVD